MIDIDRKAIDAIKEYLTANSAQTALRVQVRTSGCCEPTLAMIFDQPKPDDLVTEQAGLTLVMDPSTFQMAGDVSIELADDGECPSFTITPAKPLSEWSGFCVTTITTD